MVKLGGASELTQRWKVAVSLHHHRFGGNKLHNGRISTFNLLGILLQRLSRATVDLGFDVCKLAGDVSRVAVQHRLVTAVDLARMVQYDHLTADNAKLR